MKSLIIAASSIIALAGCTHADARLEGNAPASTTIVAAEVNLILLYSLKDGVTPADFEAWVRTVDYPEMRGLDRVSDFRTYRTERLLMGDGAPSVQYVEAFAIPDLEGFVTEDMGGETVQSVMGSFMGFAEAPQFIVVSEVK
ncbi:MAG: REDY-like protein HapK [Henriciella sp.]|nr:REDY-like protein HapK [Henriciella sp.]